MATDTWTQIGKDTLLSAGDLLDPTLTSLQLLAQVISLQLEGAGNFRAEWRNNNISTNSYAQRFNQNGAGDVTAGNASQGLLGNTTSNDEDNFVWFSQTNVLNSEKNYISRVMDAGGATAANAPNRIKTWGKGNILPVATSIQILNPLGGGDFNTGSQMQVQSPLEVGVGVGQLGSWVEIGRTILTSTGDTVDVASLPNKRYYMILIDTPPASSLGTNIRFGAGSVDSGTNYASRRADNDVENTSSSLNRIIIQANISSSQEKFGVHTIANLSNKEKLLMGHDMRTVNGSTNGPSRLENVGKWNNVASPLDVIQYVNTNVGSFAIGTELVVLGWTPADTTTTESNFWVPLAEQVLSSPADIMEVIIAPKKYLWFQFYMIASGLANTLTRFNSDSANNYGSRFDINGGGDVLANAADNIATSLTSASLRKFWNCFVINKITQDKLLIGHGIEVPTLGAGTAPSRMELVGKWRNSVSAITNISINNSNTGDIDTGSFLRVWGHD